MSQRHLLLKLLTSTVEGATENPEFRNDRPMMIHLSHCMTCEGVLIRIVQQGYLAICRVVGTPAPHAGKVFAMRCRCHVQNMVERVFFSLSFLYYIFIKSIKKSTYSLYIDFVIK